MHSLSLKSTRISQLFVCHACQSALNGIPRVQRRPFSFVPPQQQAQKTARQSRQSFRFRRSRQRQRPVGSEEPPQSGEPPKVNVHGSDPASELKTRIDKLEEELQEMRSGGLLANKALLKELSDEDRKTVIDTLKNKDKAGGKKSKSSRASEEHSTVRIVAPKEQRIYLNRLNGYLKQAGVGMKDDETRRQLWRWYMRCKQSVPSFIFRIPQEAWGTLWEAHSVVSLSNTERSAHLKIIANDMVSVGRDLAPTQRMAYIEALFLDGERETAIKEWETSEAALGRSKEVSQEFLSLGVRLFAAHNDAERAQETARVLLDERDGEDVRVLLPVINGWIRKGDQSSFQRAWSLYIWLKGVLGDEMTMDDYDSLTQGFLKAGRTDLALGVFKDMMLTGDPSSAHNSTKIYKRAVGTVAEMQSMTLSASDTHKISLEAMTVLPRRFQNKFFYGSWIKKLIGAGEVDSAAAVVELMYQRGVQPDPKVLNGIVGGWIRTGNAQAYEKAEKMGWEMIEQRKKFAFERRQETRDEEPQTEPERVQIKNGRYIFRYRTPSVPSAIIETFCILIEYYLRRNNADQIRWLNRSLGLAEIPPNTAYNNFVLKSDLKSDGLRKVWETYSAWKKAYLPSRPDLETFEFLWECEKLRLDKAPLEWLQQSPPTTDESELIHEHVPGSASETAAGSFETDSTMSFKGRKARIRRSSGFPSPRAIFADMTSWVGEQTSAQLSIHADSFTKAFYNQIVLCFIRENDGGADSGDLAGALVAMHALKSDFGVYPDEATAKLIILHVSRNTTANGAGVDSGSQTRRRREGRYNVRKVSSLLEELADRRGKFLQEKEQRNQTRPSPRPETFDQDGEGERVKGQSEHDEILRKEENLFLVSELLRTVLSRRLTRGGADLETVVQRAAWDMSVGGIHTGDHLT